VSVTPLLQLENLRQALAGRGSVTLFDSVSFTIAAGEHVAVVGQRGAGLAQLARAVALIQRPDGGRVILDGQDITRAWGSRLRTLRRTIQYVGGDARRSLSPSQALARIMAEPLEVHRLGSAAERQALVAAAASAWQLNAFLLSQRAAALSTALCQRVSLARALLLQPRLLVCDEMADRLEPAAVRPLLQQVVQTCRAANTAWLWTTTQNDLAHEFADRVLLLENGRLRPA
jgi:ABC-type glutathione transport system ATPase component